MESTTTLLRRFSYVAGIAAMALLMFAGPLSASADENNNWKNSDWKKDHSSWDSGKDKHGDWDDKWKKDGKSDHSDGKYDHSSWKSDKDWDKDWKKDWNKGHDSYVFKCEDLKWDDRQSWDSGDWDNWKNHDCGDSKDKDGRSHSHKDKYNKDGWDKKDHRDDKKDYDCGDKKDRKWDSGKDWKGSDWNNGSSSYDLNYDN
jgi:hypothetical protein